MLVVVKFDNKFTIHYFLPVRKSGAGKGVAVSSSVAVPISSSPINNNTKDDRPHEDTHV